MAYVKNKNGFEIGDWATTTKKVDSCAGYFEIEGYALPYALA